MTNGETKSYFSVEGEEFIYEISGEEVRITNIATISVSDVPIHIFRLN